MIRYEQGTKRNLKNHFGDGFDRLEELLKTVPATLPHTKLSVWSCNTGPGNSSAHLVGATGNKVLRITIVYSCTEGQRYVLSARLTKSQAFGVYERAFVNCVAQEIGGVIDAMAHRQSTSLLVGPQDVIDAAIADFLQEITRINGPNYLGIIRYLKEMAQQSYETKPITYGIVLLPTKETKKNVAVIPRDVIGHKRFQALTDGYNTALLVDQIGNIVRLICLEKRDKTGEHFRPIWLDPLADTARRNKALGVALTRTGAIMIAWNGNLLLSYRHGKWVLWYHSENIDLIRCGLRRRGTAPEGMGRLAAKLYRCALDVSFRKTGGLFVVLRSPEYVDKLVSRPEQINGTRRSVGDRALGEWLLANTIVGTEREILTDLAALDGAVVCDRQGRILSYGSVLLFPRKEGLSKIEGSRSRAAHSASYLGLSIKISADGGIDVIESGEKLLSL